MTPETWALFKDEAVPFTKTGVVNDTSRIATYVLQTGFWMQLLCLQPNQNNYLSGIVV